MTFVDNYSGWCELYLLKNKDRVFEALMSSKKFVEMLTGLKSKALENTIIGSAKESRGD